VTREREKMRAVREKVNEIERRYGGDPNARTKALVQFYKINRVNPFTSLAWQLLYGIGSQFSLSLLSWRGRSIRERLMGTAIVVEQ
jgi:membrane protein insertase Oxa1/YidC/SpoIIIJ